MVLNVTCHALHRIVGFIISCDQLFNWVGIHLYLVIANNILTNLLKAMLSLNHSLW
jgi:HD superfamily phosphohydrolase